ncbi:MAG: hypothetical protein Ct9H90mP16_00420 [Candidatus Poseidoniales archaeon]|nr:MAG: hypothetical protein Ct9H90mP16_00420 [Candidatus Poseidoniales archaeon]
MINTRFANHGGGAHLESASHESLNERLDEMTGVTINDEPTLQNLLFGVVDGTNVGMLKCDSQKILCGSTNILQGALEDPFAVVDDYTLNPCRPVRLHRHGGHRPKLGRKLVYGGHQIRNDSLRW